jgi:hypothetical protein
MGNLYRLSGVVTSDVFHVDALVLRLAGRTFRLLSIFQDSRESLLPSNTAG